MFNPLYLPIKMFFQHHPVKDAQHVSSRPHPIADGQCLLPPPGGGRLPIQTPQQ